LFVLIVVYGRSIGHGSESEAASFGCFDGGFLEFLGPAWNRSGIEPAKDAAQIARQRGIDIIAPTVDAVDVPAHAQKFGAIVIFDVMEHLVDPVKDLTRLRDLLAPGGIMLIETGNTDAPEWKRFGRRHPYCGVVEHVAFFNRRSIEQAGRRAGLRLAHFETSKHWDYGWYQSRLEAPAYLLLWRLIRALEKMKLPLPRKLHDIAAGPVPRSADPEDHFLAVLRREA
jgi:SAM-dependent methyltransferase